MKELSWQDARLVVKIADSIFDSGDWNYDTEQAYYEDVVRRFKEEKKNRENEERTQENRP